MAVFATHVVVTRGFEPVRFAPGDELPEWAASQVGAHCLEPESEVEGSAEVEPEVVEDPTSEDEADDEEPTPAPADAPDFTTPAPRRNSRTRK